MVKSKKYFIIGKNVILIMSGPNQIWKSFNNIKLMKQFIFKILKKIIKPILFFLRFCIRKIYLLIGHIKSVIVEHLIPEEMRKGKEFSYSYTAYVKEQEKLSYEYFKKFFSQSIFLPHKELKIHAIKKALENDQDQ